MKLIEQMVISEGNPGIDSFIRRALQLLDVILVLAVEEEGADFR